MTFPTVVVKDGNGTLQTVNTLPNAGQDTMANSLPVVLASNQSAIPVSGTVAVSSVAGNVAITAAALPLPSGASTSAKQPALGTAGAASADVLTVQGVASMTALKVDGSAVTQPVSAASLPLPSGASTAAKQPALGTAGAASADVITVQGVTSMTALKVDPSAVTSPISAASLPLPTGAATAAKQPALGTAGAASADVISVQGVASMTALKVDGSAVNQPTLGFQTSVKTTVTRPANVTAYVANQSMSDSTSVPTSGGFTITGAGRISGGSGVITDVTVTSSADPATLLQGELWVYDQAATNTNDGSTFNPALADRLNLVTVIPFTLASVQGGSGSDGSFAAVQGLNVGFTCVGTANLRYLIKVKNGYTPISGEVIQVAWKILQTN